MQTDMAAMQARMTQLELDKQNALRAQADAKQAQVAAEARVAEVNQ